MCCKLRFDTKSSFSRRIIHLERWWSWHENVVVALKLPRFFKIVMIISRTTSLVVRISRAYRPTIAQWRKINTICTAWTWPSIALIGIHKNGLSLRPLLSIYTSQQRIWQLTLQLSLNETALNTCRGMRLTSKRASMILKALKPFEQVFEATGKGICNFQTENIGNIFYGSSCTNDVEDALHIYPLPWTA